MILEKEISADRIRCMYSGCFIDEAERICKVMIRILKKEDFFLIRKIFSKMKKSSVTKHKEK